MLLALGIVGAVVFVLTCVLVGCQDALTVAAWNWPGLTTSEVLGVGARWAASVTVWCAVCWVAVVASRRAARRWIVVVAVGVVVGWTALGARSAFATGDVGAWWLPWWPGPIAPTYLVPADRLTGLELIEDPAVVGPGVLVPVVLVAAVVVTCHLAARQPRWPVRPRSSVQAWLVASLALGIPALGIAAVSLYATISADDGITLRESITYALHDPGRTLLVGMVTAALLVGRTPGGTLAAVLVGLSATAPRAWDWFGGGADYLLATSAAAALAIAVAGCIGPAAAALTRLENRTTGGATDYRWVSSVAEGSDAHDRAWP